MIAKDVKFCVNTRTGKVDVIGGCLCTSLWCHNSYCQHTGKKIHRQMHTQQNMLVHHPATKEMVEYVLFRMNYMYVNVLIRPTYIYTILRTNATREIINVNLHIKTCTC